MGEHAAAEIPVESTKPVVYKDVALVLKENAVTNKPKTKKSSTKAAKPAAKAKTVKAKGNGHTRTGTKMEVIRGLLTRKSGCTSDEVMKLCGWPSVSMPAQAKALGLKLRKEKIKGERTRYWGA
jgi:hypothetical protein